MITKKQYFGYKIEHENATQQRQDNAEVLLSRVNVLLDYAEMQSAYEVVHNPYTDTQISGSKGGSGDGGFRLQTSSTGAARSSHKEGMGIDVYDPGDRLDKWLTDEILEEFDLYREHPDYTRGWCHLQTRPVVSGGKAIRTFKPY